MKLRDILTIIGACCLSVGPVLMHHVPDSTVYTVGECLTAIGSALLGSRAVLKDDDGTTTPPATSNPTTTPPTTKP